MDKFVCFGLLAVQVTGFNIDTNHPIILSASGQGFGHSLELARNNQVNIEVSCILFVTCSLEWEFSTVCWCSIEFGKWRNTGLCF